MPCKQWNRNRRALAGCFLFIFSSSITGGAGGPVASAIDSHGSLSFWGRSGINWQAILKKMAKEESGNDPRAHNRAEGARGLLQIREAALEDYNSWNNTRIRPSELFDPEINVRVGGYYLAVILYSNRCGRNLFQAVASFNIGLNEVRRGWYPADYMTNIFQAQYERWMDGKVVIEEYRNHVGRRIVRLMVWTNRRYPALGERDYN